MCRITGRQDFTDADAERVIQNQNLAASDWPTLALYGPNGGSSSASSDPASTFVPDPNRAIPWTESPKPIRPWARTERQEPRVTKSQMDF